MTRTFRGYEIGKRIGSGGMSVIREGVQTSLDQKVAIKILHPILADDEHFIARFEREAKSASTLRGHRNIVNVLDFGSDEDAYYIVMEHIDGGDLRALHKSHSVLPPEITLAILEEVAYGLDAAHQKGIIHRDVKPSNVLLGRDGSVKLVDFGLARSGTTDLDSTLTQPGSVMGTPAYMSPEQVAGSVADARSDIFSLGVMAYELFTGDKPFASTSLADTREQILSRPTPRMRQEGLLLPREVESLVYSMLEKDPDARPEDMSTVLRGIEDCMEALDESGALLKHRRQYLTSFAKAPSEYGRELLSKRVARHLERAATPSESQSDLGRRIEEYRSVLILDPRNETARTALQSLRSREREGEIAAILANADEKLRLEAAASPLDTTLEEDPPVNVDEVSHSRSAAVEEVEATRVATTTPDSPPVAAASSSAGGGARWRIAVIAILLVLSSGIVWVSNVSDPEPQDLTAVSDREPAPLEQPDVETSPAPLTDEGEIAAAVKTVETDDEQKTAGDSGSPTIELTDSPTAAVEDDADAPELEEAIPEPVLESTPQVRPASGYIRIAARPFANVFRDGQQVGDAVQSLVLVSPSGSRHEIEVEHPTLGRHRWESIVSRSDTTRLAHTFEWGELQVSWLPQGNATLYVDEVLPGNRSEYVEKLPVGRHRIGVRRRGYKLKSVYLRRGTDPEVRLAADPGWSSRISTFLVDVPTFVRVDVRFEFESKRAG